MHRKNSIFPTISEAGNNPKSLRLSKNDHRVSKKSSSLGLEVKIFNSWFPCESYIDIDIISS